MCRLNRLVLSAAFMFLFLPACLAQRCESVLGVKFGEDRASATYSFFQTWGISPTSSQDKEYIKYVFNFTDYSNKPVCMGVMWNEVIFYCQEDIVTGITLRKQCSSLNDALYSFDALKAELKLEYLNYNEYTENVSYAGLKPNDGSNYGIKAYLTRMVVSMAFGPYKYEKQELLDFKEKGRTVANRLRNKAESDEDNSTDSIVSGRQIEVDNSETLRRRQEENAAKIAAMKQQQEEEEERAAGIKRQLEEAAKDVELKHQLEEETAKVSEQKRQNEEEELKLAELRQQLENAGPELFIDGNQTSARELDVFGGNVIVPVSIKNGSFSGCTVNCTSDWVSTKLTDAGNLIIDYEANTSLFTRSSFVEIKNGSATAKLRLSQQPTLKSNLWRDELSRLAQSPSYIYDDGNTYTGQMKDGLAREGYGAYHYQDGDIYFIGEWSNNTKNGISLNIVGDGYVVNGFSNCMIMVCDYVDGAKNGYATCYNDTGKLLYDGQVLDDNIVGSYPGKNLDRSKKFQFIKIGSDYYLGETKGGKPYGCGLQFYSDGSIWFGKWEDGNKTDIGDVILYP